MSEKGEPIIKRFVHKINLCGKETEIINLDYISQKKKEELLKKVFHQGLLRLGYEQIN